MLWRCGLRSADAEGKDWPELYDVLRENDEEAYDPLELELSGGE